MHHPGWVLYGFVGVVVTGVGIYGMFTGLRNGIIQIDFEQDTPEARSDARWAIWSLFSSAVASGVLWPLSVPVSLRTILRFLETREMPSFTITRPEDPFRRVDKDQMLEFFAELIEWRKTCRERFGDPHAVSGLMNALAQEGRKAFQAWPEKEWRAALTESFRSVLDGYKEPSKEL